MSDSTQSVAGCAGLREECRNDMFTEMNRLHDKQTEKSEKQHKVEMKELGTIKETVAYMRGKQAGISPVLNMQREPHAIEKKENKNAKYWVSLFVSIFNSWGPYVAIILLYGISKFLDK